MVALLCGSHRCIQSKCQKPQTKAKCACVCATLASTTKAAMRQESLGSYIRSPWPWAEGGQRTVISKWVGIERFVAG